MKATILKYCDMSLAALTSFKAFLKWSTFCKFDTAELSTPSLRIATATNERGEFSVFAPIENVLLVSYCMSSNNSKDQARRAGDAIDAEIAKLGQRLGVSKAMIVLPEGVTIPDDDGETLRVHIIRIPQSVAMGLGTKIPSTAVSYVN